MTDTQFQLLDELYFVTSFAALANACTLPEETLLIELQQLWATGWLRVLYPNADTELPYQPDMPTQDFRKYYFLASKAGLLAHNSL